MINRLISYFPVMTLRWSHRLSVPFLLKPSVLEECRLVATMHARFISIPVDRIDFNYARSSGPGGQNVNKVNTKAELRFHVMSADW